MTSEQLYQNLLTFVEKSEARIGRTNEMEQTLARTCEHNILFYANTIEDPLHQHHTENNEDL